MHFDESMWVALGFVLFVILVWKKAGAALSETLDSRSAAIKAELDEARKLHEEAKAELVALKGLKSEAEREAKTIVTNAKAAAERFLADGDREQQRQCWSRAAELDDDDAEPLVRLGNLLHADGLPGQALRLLERARAMAPANAHVHASLGSAAYSMGGGSPAHFRAAVAHYEQAAALAGGLPIAQAWLCAVPSVLAGVVATLFVQPWRKRENSGKVVPSKRSDHPHLRVVRTPEDMLN